jgi:hypothetical protein
MKKRTSKSASATRRTSSRSGTSDPMADTEKAAPEITITSRVTRTLQSIVEEVEKMTPEEFRQSLVRAGIANEDGTLTDKYKRRK